MIARRWLLLGVWAALLTLLGCGGVAEGTLAGTDDVELTYEVDRPGAPDLDGVLLRSLVLQRLGAARIAADVDPATRSGRIAVVVDEALGAHVDEVLTWTGTLLFYEPEPQLTLPRLPSFDLTVGEQGGDRWLEGGRAEVLKAIQMWPTSRDRRVLAEPMWTEGSLLGRQRPTRWRTRVVRSPPLFELGDGALVAWGDGPSLRVRGGAGSAAATVLDDARKRGPLVMARGIVSLGAPRFEGDALLLEFGTGAEAYARARHEKQLLTSVRLPSLRRVDAIGLPPNRVLEVACLVVPVLLSLGWLVFVRRFDRAHPEPAWLVGLTFALGALAVVPAGALETLLASLSPWLDPGLIPLGGRGFAFPLAFVVFTVVVGLSEEGCKRLAAELAVRRREFDEPVDGIVYGIVASLGFAAAENVRYFALGRLNVPLVIARCFMSVPAHMFFGALWGYALGARLVDRKKRSGSLLLLAATCHGLFDALLSTEGAGLLAVVLNVGLASAFVVLVRRALRHGVVTSEMIAIKPEDRALFRVGRPRLFVTSAVLLHVLAFGIFVLGASYQIARHRPSLLFVAGSSVMVALLAVAALGVSTTMPLDVAIDAYGVTFAGAARPWRQIHSFKTLRDRIKLDCEAGPIELGPAPPAILEAIADALRRRLGMDRGDAFGP